MLLKLMGIFPLDTPLITVKTYTVSVDSLNLND